MTAEEFNRRYPVGTKLQLKAKSPSNAMGSPITVEVRRSAYTLSTGKAVVPLKDIGPKPIADIEMPQQAVEASF